MKPQNVVFLLVIFLSLGVSEEIEDDNSKVWKALNEMKNKLAETENRLTKTENKLAATENKLAETIDELRTVKEKCEVKGKISNMNKFYRRRKDVVLSPGKPQK